MTRATFIATMMASTMLVASAQAAIVVGPTIGGIATFTDTNTGRNWARMDIYFDQSHNAMAADITFRGFTVAVFSEVDELLDTLPLDAGQWTSYAAIMGRAPNRELIWGSFAPVSGNNTVDWAFAFNGETSWTSYNFSTPADQVPNGGTNVADMNIWAYAGGDARVPEPASWAMMIAGFGLVGAAMRRRAMVAA